MQEGGALLVASGDDYAGKTSLAYTAIGSVLPAMPTGQLIERPYKAKLSGDGVKHPVTRGLPGSEAKDPQWGRWFRQVEVAPGRGRVLMHGADERPLLVLDRKTKGRVALLLSDHAWLWARGYEGGGPHTDLLRRLSHWLMKEPDLEEERLLASAKGLKLTVERRSMEEETVGRVQVSAPGGESSEITLDKAGPGLWRATVDVAVPGLYKLQTHSSLGAAHRRRPRRRRGRARDERGDGHRREAAPARRPDRQRRILDARGGPACQRARRAWTCRASPCSPTPACSPAPAGSASRTARRS